MAVKDDAMELTLVLSEPEVIEKTFLPPQLLYDSTEAGLTLRRTSTVQSSTTAADRQGQTGGRKRLASTFRNERFNSENSYRNERWEKFKLNFLYFEWMVNENSMGRRIFRIFSAVNVITLCLNSIPPFIGHDTEDVVGWRNYYTVILSIDAFLSLFYTVHLIGRIINSRYWIKKLDKQVTWASDYHWSRHFSVAIITLGLYYSVAIESYRLACIENYTDPGNCSNPFSCDNASITCPPHFTMYYPFILRIFAIVSAVRALSPVKQLTVPEEEINKFLKYLRIKHLINAALFYVIIVFLYGLIGVYVIGPLNMKCIRTSYVEGMNISSDSCIMAEPKDLQSVISVPDYNCNPKSERSLCPADMTCRCVYLERNQLIQADFQNLGLGLLSVFESVTQELWTRNMYRAIDGGNKSMVVLFFFTLILFLVFLVQESIFLIVIVESFATIRNEPYIEGTKKEEELDDEWWLKEEGGKLTLVFKEQSQQVKWRHKYKKQWKYFQRTMLILVFLDALIMATRGSYNIEAYSCYLLFVAVWEIIISVLFAMEVVAYLAFYWWKPFVSRVSNWLLTIVAVGSLGSAIWELAAPKEEFTCNGIPVSVPPANILIVFQSLRFIRLIWLFNPIGEFYYQVISKENRLLAIVLAVLGFIFVVATINIQLFAFIIPEKQLFSDIMAAYQSQFQLFFIEGWVELLSELIFEIPLWPLVNLWIIFLNFIASLILLNFFTAIFLDNLDLEEEEKPEKLEKALAKKEKAKVPWLWKLSTKIGGGAETVKVPEQNGFDAPQVKMSTANEFLNTTDVSKELSAHRGWLDEEEEPEGYVASFIPPKSSRQQLITRSNQLDEPLKRDRRQRQQTVSNLVQQLEVILKMQRNDLDMDNRDPLDYDSAKSESKLTNVIDELREKHQYFDRALFLMTPNNPIRKLCSKILTAKMDEPGYESHGRSIWKAPFRKIKYYVQVIISLLPYFSWFMFLATVGLILLQFVEDIPTAPGSTSYNVVPSTFYDVTPEVTSSVTQFQSFRLSHDILFVAITLMELLLKIGANGLLCNPYAAISGIFDILDWIIVIATTIRVIIVSVDVGTLTGPSREVMGVLLILWSLRPLRIISIIPSVKEVLLDLWKGRKRFFFGFFLFAIFVFVFASMGTQLFSGALGKCNDPDIELEESCTGEFEMNILLSYDIMFDELNVAITVPRVWIQEPRDFRFSHIVYSAVSLLSLLPLEGWPNLKEYLSVRQQLFPFVTLVYYEFNLFMHVYIFIGVNLGLTLFLGLVVANYRENKSDHAAMLTYQQSRWRDLILRIKIARLKKVPPVPSEANKLKYFLYHFVSDTYHIGNQCGCPFNIRIFRDSSSFVILINALTLCIRWADNIPAIEVAIFFSIICNTYFIFETILKLIGFGIRPYFYSVLNRLECALSIFSFAYIIVAIISLSDQSLISYEVLSQIALASAVTRWFTLLGKYEVLTAIFKLVLRTFRKAVFLILLLLAVILTFANIGTALFGRIEKGEGTELKNANFRTHENSLFLGIRIMTGEDWYQLMGDVSAIPPYCSPDFSNCGSPWWAPIYFLSFFFTVIFIFLNIFQAVVWETFSLFYNEDDTLLDHMFMKTFRHNWTKFDEQAKGSIPLKVVKFFIRSLPLTQYYSYLVNEKTGEKERCKVYVNINGLVLQEMYTELNPYQRNEGKNEEEDKEEKQNKNTELNPDQKKEGRNEEDDEEERQNKITEHKRVSFKKVLMLLAYRAEDIEERLIPNELKRRITLEQNVQEEAATECIHIWMKKYLKPVLDSLTSTPEIQIQLATNQPVVTTTEYFTSTNEGEQTFSPPRWLSPPPRSAQDESSRPNNLDSALPKDLFIAAEEEEEDPNHAWLEQQMMYESDDDELFNL